MAGPYYANLVDVDGNDQYIYAFEGAVLIVPRDTDPVDGCTVWTTEGLIANTGLSVADAEAAVIAVAAGTYENVTTVDGRTARLLTTSPGAAFGFADAGEDSGDAISVILWPSGVQSPPLRISLAALLTLFGP